jgi:hypothetical protein
MSTIDKNEAALSAHEQVCALRYESINARLKRLEQILIATAGFMIAVLISNMFKLH